MIDDVAVPAEAIATVGSVFAGAVVGALAVVLVVLLPAGLFGRWRNVRRDRRGRLRR